MFSFQAIHNPAQLQAHPPAIVIYQCQCSLFKQFTTVGLKIHKQHSLSFISVNVLFSSNSQQSFEAQINRMSCHLSVSMFSFQAIHNNSLSISGYRVVVIYQCQCSLFKQFTTTRAFLMMVRVLSFISVNVLFSSNSQLIFRLCKFPTGCHLSVSMFSFQAIHNSVASLMPRLLVVIYQCQCSLFKQFTTSIRRISPYSFGPQRYNFFPNRQNKSHTPLDTNTIAAAARDGTAATLSKVG